jgi:hypothetical protein
MYESLLDQHHKAINGPKKNPSLESLASLVSLR